ncbi:hypothetical protein PABG_02094 [Paracoccidioides brasiliensis Pb03]|uniref:Globin-sensor domain-containing protein n=2 Tax=Paracoccidioides TaxID=38946 RepID=C1G0V6_PARBD|nr:uncharacterized protein PADG_00496 [Paracoccidioides brasiliensis Pb18]EEH19835.1 hypothetical protein PABG_02094 [Paracoccidioides brasiliensis Pb03]EEH44207.1 hypothetical protein PADG_00496 [Paracoccidioides brasiliensis Pb18]ODH50562.1 hypothetical protein GX48_03244 [Paracoccidioides brasiliensis]
MSAINGRTITHIDEDSLTDLKSRIAYAKSFLQFTEEDGALIQSAKDIVAPAVPAILEAVYTKLLSYDITAKSFVPRQPEQAATEPAEASISELSLDHPNIVHRKDFLKNYLVRLVSNKNWADDSPFWDYLDKVSVIHTGKAGFKHREKRPKLRVELMHMSLLLGFVEDLMLKTTLAADGLDLRTKTSVLAAFNKLMWIQNDLFLRHYVAEKPELD